MNVLSQPSSSTTEQDIESTELVESSDSEMEIQSGDEQKSEKQVEPNKYDPHTWPAILSSSFREKIVNSGLPPIPTGKVYPRKGREFKESIFFPHISMVYVIRANGSFTHNPVIQFIVFFAQYSIEIKMH